MSNIDDYMALIKGDPIYQQTLADNAANLSAAGANLGKNVANLVIELGYVPDLQTIGQALGLSPSIVGWLKSNVDWPTVSKLADQSNKNHTSLLSQLSDQHQTNVGGIKDSLAARGLYRSGGLSSDLGREAQRFTGANFNALRDAGNAIGGLYGDYLGIKSGIDTSNSDALRDAYERAREMYPNGVPATASMPPVVSGHPDTDPAAWQYIRIPHPGPFKAV